MPLRNPQPGQTLAEYALIGLLVALLCIPALTLLGQGIFGGFNGILGSGSSQPTFHAMSGSGSGSALPVSGASFKGGSGVDIADSSTHTTVQTSGANGSLEALQNNMQALQMLYDQETDPDAKLLLAKLLATLNATGGTDVVQAYQLGDMQIVSARLLEAQDTWIAIRGSSEFGRLNAADQARLTQVMDNFQTQAQYFTQN